MSASHDRDNKTAGHEVSDGVLATRVQVGDRDAFETLARRHMRSVSAVVSSILHHREDVDDAVQETFLRVLERIHSFNPKRPFTPWLYQVARNVARNRWTALKRRQTDDPSSLERVGSDNESQNPGTVVELSELRHRVELAIEALPARQRAAFRLHDVEGFETHEVADMLGVSVGTVRANLHHARRALREKLEPFAREWI